jgi:hypothetical protein
MVSVEEIIRELRKLSPEQVDEVARVVRGLVQTIPPPVPSEVVREAVEHGWPAELFTELIGSMPDLERAPQPATENRAPL